MYFLLTTTLVWLNQKEIIISFPVWEGNDFEKGKLNDLFGER